MTVGGSIQDPVDAAVGVGQNYSYDINITRPHVVHIPQDGEGILHAIRVLKASHVQGSLVRLITDGARYFGSGVETRRAAHLGTEIVPVASRTPEQIGAEERSHFSTVRAPRPMLRHLSGKWGSLGPADRELLREQILAVVSTMPLGDGCDSQDWSFAS